MPASFDPQLALDERALTHPDLEKALEKHLRARDDASEARGVVKTAKAEIDTHLAAIGDFPADTALRVGRFRITKRHIEADHREFDTAARDQISIGLIDEDGAPARRSSSAAPRSVVDGDDWDDLRPKGEVNTDALRGEADRAILPDEPTPLRRSKKTTGSAGQPPIH